MREVGRHGVRCAGLCVDQLNETSENIEIGSAFVALPWIFLHWWIGVSERIELDIIGGVVIGPGVPDGPGENKLFLSARLNSCSIQN